MEQILSHIKTLAPAAELLCSPYALSSDGSVFSPCDELPDGLHGIKKISGSLFLRWDGRVCCFCHGEYARHISLLRGVRDMCSGTNTDLFLRSDGSLQWINRGGVHGISFGSLDTDWTDVKSIHLCCDPYSDEMSYGDYAIGLGGKGVRAAMLHGGDDRSREISDYLNSLEVFALSSDCRALTTDGKIHNFGTKGMGKVRKGPFIDFDEKYSNGIIARCPDCTLHSDGSISFSNGRYPTASADEWQDIIAISYGFCPGHSSDHLLMALRSDGRLLCAWEFDSEKIDTAGFRLFSSLESLPHQLAETERRCIAEGLRLDEEECIRADEREKARRKEELNHLKQYRSQLYSQRQQLRGLFSGAKKRKLDEQIAGIDKQIKEF